MAYARDNPKIKAFLAEIGEVCRKHGFSIAHEDHWGGFIIRDYDACNYDVTNIEWLNDAQDETSPEPDVKTQ